MSIGIIEEIQGVAAVGFSKEFTSGIVVGMLGTIDGFAGSETVCVIKQMLFEYPLLLTLGSEDPRVGFL